MRVRNIMSLINYTAMHQIIGPFYCLNYIYHSQSDVVIVSMESVCLYACMSVAQPEIFNGGVVESRRRRRRGFDAEGVDSERVGNRV